MTMDQKFFWIRKGQESSLAYLQKKRQLAADNITPNPPTKRRATALQRRRAAKMRAATKKASG